MVWNCNKDSAYISSFLSFGATAELPPKHQSLVYYIKQTHTHLAISVTKRLRSFMSCLDVIFVARGFLCQFHNVVTGITFVDIVRLLLADLSDLLEASRLLIVIRRAGLALAGGSKECTRLHVVWVGNPCRWSGGVIGMPRASDIISNKEVSDSRGLELGGRHDWRRSWTAGCGCITARHWGFIVDIIVPLNFGRG